MSENRNILWPSLLRRLTKPARPSDDAAFGEHFASWDDVRDALRTSIASIVRVPNLHQSHSSGSNRETKQSPVRPPDSLPFPKDNGSRDSYKQRIESSVLNYGVPHLSGSIERKDAIEFRSKIETAIIEYEPRIARTEGRKEEYARKNKVIRIDQESFTPRKLVELSIAVNLRTKFQASKTETLNESIDMVNGRLKK